MKPGGLSVSRDDDFLVYLPVGGVLNASFSFCTAVVLHSSAHAGFHSGSPSISLASSRSDSIAGISVVVLLRPN